jgi:hypothetical protein
MFISVVDLDTIARIAHEVNRAFCMSIGDNSQPSWEDAPEWQRESAVSGVCFHLNELQAGREPAPSASHENWMKEKIADGWTYGAIKDPEKKQHPCLLPYDKLPREQRSKDYIFGAIVKAFHEGDVDISRVTTHVKGTLARGAG